MATISDGVTTITPDLVVGWATTRAARTVVHAILGREDPDVTLRPSATRSGVLRELFADPAAAQAALDSQSTGSVWTLDTPEQPELSMVFVVAGDVSMLSTDDDAAHFTVEVTYREVYP